MKISEIITDKYKLRMPPTVYYDLLADVLEAEDEQEPTTKNDLGVDCISRADAIKGLGEPPYVWTDSDFEIQQLADWKTHKKMLESLPSVTPQESKTLQFAKWVATEIFDEMWEYNKDAFAEIACRNLAKIEIVREKGDTWELVELQESEDKK